MAQPGHVALGPDCSMPSNGPAQPTELAQPLFPCSVPHCNKLFNRKEHLRRHLKSHNPYPKYKCTICGRRYARSDVLKRHIENHPLNPHPRQPRRPPCNGCVERKTRCNGSTPCQTCIRASVECIRPTIHWPPNLDGDAEAVTLTGDETSPECPANDGSDSNKPQSQPQEQLGATLTTAPAPTTQTPETASAHSFGPDTSPVSSNTLFNSSEQGMRWLGPDSATQCSWPLLSFADMTLQPTSTTDAVTNNMTAGLDLYRQDGQRSEHILATESQDPTLRLQGTDPQMNLTSMALAHNGVSLGTSATNNNLLNDLSTALNNDVLSGNANTSSSQFSMLSSGSTQIFETMPDPQLHIHDRQSVERLVESYFRDVHPCWPILHQPTFSTTKCSPILLRSILVLGSLAENGPEHLSLASAVINTVMAAQHVTEEQFLPLETLQAMLLCLVYCITCPNRDKMAFAALRLIGVLVAALRYQQVFAGMHDPEEQQLVEPDAFQSWLSHEARHRLAYSCLRVDAYLSILLDQPPSIRYFELSIPLPKPARLWNARTAEERSDLQWSTPAGREKALFCNILRDSLEDENDKRRCYPLTGKDYHLSLCALQVGVWEAAREAHSFASDELSTKAGPGGPIYVWRRHLDFWRQTMEKHGRFTYNYDQRVHCESSDTADADAADEEPFAPLTLILWHVSCMKMHAPISHLQVSAALNSKTKRLSLAAVMPGADWSHHDICARIRSWMGVRCPRVSCWHAAQITRVICDEAANPERACRLRLNPLACHGLFLAAVVVASYAFYFQSCGVCTVDSTSGLPLVVDLFLAADGDEALQTWWDTGKGYAVWGPKHISLCRCQMDDLVMWLRTMLASMDKDLALSFVTFTEKLKLE